MKTIIAGSRNIKRMDQVAYAIEVCGWPVTEIISGNAPGVDKLGELYGHQHGLICKVFKANWNKFGRGAGFRRNVEMAEYAEALVAIWDGQSRGTEHMIDTAIANGLRVYVYRTDGGK